MPRQAVSIRARLENFGFFLPFNFQPESVHNSALSHEENHMTWATVEGFPFPQGVSWIVEEQAYNFSLYSKHAESVTLLLYQEGDLIHPIATYSMDYLKNKSWRNWHCRLPEPAMRDARYYAYRISGPPPNGRFEWHAFNPQKILFDPYAKSIFFPPDFDQRAAVQPGPNDGKAPLGVIEKWVDPFAGGNRRAIRHESDAIIYELHVRGFTNNPNSGVAPEKRGTFSGLIEKIPYLKDLGVTVVELMPIFQYDPQAAEYWGYMPLGFFAPHHGYASSKRPGDANIEFSSMVQALHEAGIEVLLDVVYNHTGEGNQNGPVYSYKGINNSTYYFISNPPSDPYANFSGTGNSLHCANRHVRRMIVDSLRHWARDMHVDGFRFDLASVFSRKDDGSININDPAIYGEIVTDPTLATTRLIAEPWDAAGAYQLGRSFPAVRWSQWNGRFRDDVRRFVKGDAGTVTALMQRLYGSDDLFPDDRMDAYHPYQSVNYIASHDGFTLYDLVSYNQKRNWENGQNNTDGTNDNYSWNCGWEGDEGVPPEVMKLRKRQVKNFSCLLFLSNGTPMFRMGDEFLRRQGGNNNPYNQDNPTTWLDWDRLQANQDIFRFFKRMIAFRKAHPSLCRSRFWRDDIRWYGVGPTVDMSYDSHSVAFSLHGASQQDDDLYVMVNAYWEDLPFILQEGGFGEWKRVIDTGLDSPGDFCDPGQEVPLQSGTYLVGARSIVVLMRKRG